MKTAVRTAARNILLLPLIVMAALASCSGKDSNTTETRTNSTSPMVQNTAAAAPADTASARVRVNTDLGSFTVLLYGDTPKHRDNFLRLAREHYYDGTLFHRVIKDFMVQAGDPDSRNAAPGVQLGGGGPEYKIDAEIVFPAHFHKRGALAAARQGDQVNPEKKSSGSQFYIVTGKTMTAGEMEMLEQQMQNSVAQSAFNDMAMQQRDHIIALQRAGDRAGLQALQDTLVSRAMRYAQEHPRSITDEMRNAYTTVGGAPHLDGDYTVFGEITEGMDVIDRIEAAETDRADRPRTDIRIISMEVL